jgi:hypothetical protein
MRKSYLFFVLAIVFFLTAHKSFAKGCGGQEVLLKEPTELNSELGKIPVQLGKVTICWPFFSGEKPNEETLKEKGLLVRGAVLSKSIKLAGIPLTKGTQIDFPDPFAHEDADFFIVSNRVFHFGKISLVGSTSLKIEVNAFEPVDVKEGRRVWIPRKDGMAAIKGYLSENTKLNDLLVASGNSIKFEGKTEDILKGNSDPLTLLLGTIIAGTLKTPKGSITFENQDVISLPDAKTREAIIKNGYRPYIDLFTKGTKYIFPSKPEGAPFVKLTAKAFVLLKEKLGAQCPPREKWSV